MNNTNLRLFKQSRFFWIGIISLVFIVNACALYFFLSNHYEKELRKNLLNQSKMISAMIDLKRIEKLEGDGRDLNKAEYHYIKNQFSELQKQFKEVKYVYLVGQNTKGEVFFYLDNTQENATDFSPPGQHYEEASNYLKSLFAVREGGVEGPLEDRWGMFVTAFSPIYDKQGERIIAILGVDVSADVWIDLKKQKIKVAFVIALIFISLMCLVVFVLQKFFKDAEHMEALKEKDERIFQIAEHSRSIFWETNAKGVFSYLSPTWGTLLGYEEKDFLNKKLFYESDLLEQSPEYCSQLRLCFEARSSIKNIVKAVRTKKGDVLHFNTYAFPFYSAKGEYLGYRGIDTDVTLKKQIDEKKNDIQKEYYNSAKHSSIGKLAAGISHEINNPLTIVHGFVSLIQQKVVQKNSQTDYYFQSIFEAIERIKSISNALKVFSNAEDREVANLDIHALIKNSIDLIKEIYRTKGLEIHLNLKAVNCMTKGVPDQIQLVLMNLLSNAADSYNGQAGEILIETSERNDSIRISVKDFGCGIPDILQPKVFETFFTTKEVDKGKGLGLSMSYAVVKAHQGSISFVSRENYGSIFNLEFPKANFELQKNNKPDLIAQEEQLYKGRALVVDDEDGIRQILQAFLARESIYTVTVPNGEKALSILKDQSFDFIFTDINMPGISGLELISELKQLKRNEKIIAISGGCSQDCFTQDEKLDISQLVDAHMEKPFKASDVSMTLSKVLASRSP